MSVKFQLEKVENAQNGALIDTVVKYSDGPNQQQLREEWCNVLELDQLFNACVAKWGSNWDLQKVIYAIQETEIT